MLARMLPALVLVVVLAACGGGKDDASDVVASIHGTTAEGPIDLTGEVGSYSRGAVRLECQAAAEQKLMRRWYCC